MQRMSQQAVMEVPGHKHRNKYSVRILIESTLIYISDRYMQVTQLCLPTTYHTYNQLSYRVESRLASIRFSEFRLISLARDYYPNGNISLGIILFAK